LVISDRANLIMTSSAAGGYCLGVGL
jgi:hypothetical protein